MDKEQMICVLAGLLMVVLFALSAIQINKSLMFNSFVNDTTTNVQEYLK